MADHMVSGEAVGTSAAAPAAAPVPPLTRRLRLKPLGQVQPRELHAELHDAHSVARGLFQWALRRMMAQFQAGADVDLTPAAGILAGGPRHWLPA